MATFRAFSVLRKTPLSDFNAEVLKARMVGFAGYSMPVEYKEKSGGGMAEHKQVRNSAGLFDVSHMGVLKIRGDQRLTELSKLVTADLSTLKPGQAIYSLLMNDKGGIIDDTIITSFPDHISMVVNAGCKDKDIAYLRSALPSSVNLEYLEDWGLLALQGPLSAAVLQRLLNEDLSQVKFMHAFYSRIHSINADVLVTRCGYTGEDGFELTVRPEKSVQLTELLLSQPEVKPIGLGARDSLRLEAGLCLYGHDLNEETTPIEAGLIWTIPKHRREKGGFAGDQVVLRQIKEGPKKVRVGFTMKEGSSAREGAVFVKGSEEIGTVCSGGFSPMLKHPIGMAYVNTQHSQLGTEHDVLFRGKNVKVNLAKMPFFPTRYFK